MGGQRGLISAVHFLAVLSIDRDDDRAAGAILGDLFGGKEPMHQQTQTWYRQLGMIPRNGCNPRPWDVGKRLFVLWLYTGTFLLCLLEMAVHPSWLAGCLLCLCAASIVERWS